MAAKNLHQRALRTLAEQRDTTQKGGWITKAADREDGQLLRPLGSDLPNDRISPDLRTAS